MLLDDQRRAELTSWASTILVERGVCSTGDVELETASDDASFRRYFRFRGDPSFIFVDAPPESEDNLSFVHVSELMQSAELNVPRVLAADLDRGYMMLTDLGETLYLARLGEGDGPEIEALYEDAFRALVRLQSVDATLPHYDEELLRAEMALFPSWFLDRHLQLRTYDQTLFEETAKLMVQSAAEQPQVLVHRDYHCRNLLVTPQSNPGIIDFQDAVIGPVTYDLVSLLKDCYHRFPRDQVERWVEQFRQRLVAQGRLRGTSQTSFLRWFDLMGFQRHLKCVGIFSRLHLRDGKRRYLADIPLVLRYMNEVCEEYGELAAFGSWLRGTVLPRLENGASSA